MPKAVMTGEGKLGIERGLHQQVSWEQNRDNSAFRVSLFHDHLQNPVLEASQPGQEASSFALAADRSALLDRNNGWMRLAGEDFSSLGIEASYQHSLPGGNQFKLSYANGDALSMPTQFGTARWTKASQIAANAHPRRTQMYALSLSGTLEGSGTRWRATYRWQAG